MMNKKTNNLKSAPTLTLPHGGGKNCLMSKANLAIRVGAKGFTLAEVLITLGVIGVVASMTMPALIQDYQAHKRVNQLKKAVSVYQQAFTQMTNEYGTLDTWGLTESDKGEVDENGKRIYDFSSSQLINIRIAKYLKGLEFFKADDVMVHSYLMDGTTTWSGDNGWKPAADNRYFKLPDGTIFGTGMTTANCNNENSICTSLWVILPNANKKALLGKDIFAFDIYPIKGIVPRGNTTGELKQDCSKQNPKSNNDRCTAWVMFHGNMDYLKCDDLNWETKTRCK